MSPWPAALALRALFGRWGAARAERQLARVPPGVVASALDEPYGPEREARLDVFVPGQALATGSLPPLVAWIHGGAFVAGSKEELRPYLRVLAAQGFAVAGIGYSRAPGARYPTPVRQAAAALQHLARHGDRLGLDPARVVVAGDSAGAHVAAQLAAVATDPAYAAELGAGLRLDGASPRVDPASLRGVVLCCGVFDVTAIREDGPLRHLVESVGWAYSGSRRYRRDARFITTSTLPGRVTGAYPSTFLTAGNADPLAPQSRAMAAALRRRGVPVDELTYAADHEPALGHEYQFELDQPDGRAAFTQMVAFCRRCTGGAPRSP